MNLKKYSSKVAAQKSTKERLEAFLKSSGVRKVDFRNMYVQTWGARQTIDSLLGDIGLLQAKSIENINKLIDMYETGAIYEHEKKLLGEAMDTIRQQLDELNVIIEERNNGK